jgi:hypothetical protein
MFFSKIRLRSVLAALMSLISVNAVNAADSWTFGVTPQLLLGRYSDSQQRDSLTGYGVLLNADYLDKSGIYFGYSSQTVNGNSGFPDIQETSLYLSGRYTHYSDSFGGKLGVRMDGYNIDDQTDSSTTSGGTGKSMGKTQPGSSFFSLNDKTRVFYAQLDFMNFANTFYADLGYARSHYDYETLQDNNVAQFTATAGFALNNRYDWLQSRGYFIRLEHGDNTAGVTQSNALELKWLHWFKPGFFLRTHSSIVKLVLGKRLFPVDPDAQTTYSIADLQTGSVAAGMDWKLWEQGTFLLLVGYDRYENPAIEDKYQSRYLFSSFSFKW